MKYAIPMIGHISILYIATCSENVGGVCYLDSLM